LGRITIIHDLNHRIVAEFENNKTSPRPFKLYWIYSDPICLWTTSIRKLNLYYFMKRILFLIGLLAVLMVSISSCASTKMKKDCQGNRHYKQANGIYL